ncbi:putative secreted RxLR effector protein [Phytophthora cinnamomi]|uniref:putative secreted RxLR effector protein n=1 Tax=Phytophthora cinnamomi TaxID=4785 RepID=UPI0035598D84|nr:putative secreted RxLR effector protein [Phytophthora cinnamomi]
MRFAYIVLVSAVALFAGGNRLAAAEVNNNEISHLTSSEVARAVAAEQNDKRHLRSVNTDEKNEKTNNEEEKGLFEYMLDNAIAKKKYRRWYRAGLNPREVKSMMKKREAAGDYVDWDVVNGYSTYYRRRRNSLFNW